MFASTLLGHLLFYFFYFFLDRKVYNIQLPPASTLFFANIQYLVTSKRQFQANTQHIPTLLPPGQGQHDQDGRPKGEIDAYASPIIPDPEVKLGPEVTPGYKATSKETIRTIFRAWYVLILHLFGCIGMSLLCSIAFMITKLSMAIPHLVLPMEDSPFVLAISLFEITLRLHLL